MRPSSNPRSATPPVLKVVRMKSSQEKLKVAVRVRPQRRGQKCFVVEKTAKVVLEIEPDEGAVAATWGFDHVFDDECSTEEV
jgi:hypothetical protein